MIIFEPKTKLYEQGDTALFITRASIKEIMDITHIYNIFHKTVQESNLKIRMFDDNPRKNDISYYIRSKWLERNTIRGKCLFSDDTRDQETSYFYIESDICTLTIEGNRDSFFRFLSFVDTVTKERFSGSKKFTNGINPRIVGFMERIPEEVKERIEEGINRFPYSDSTNITRAILDKDDSFYLSNKTLYNEQNICHLVCSGRAILEILENPRFEIVSKEPLNKESYSADFRYYIPQFVNNLDIPEDDVLDYFENYLENGIYNNPLATLYNVVLHKGEQKSGSHAWTDLPEMKIIYNMILE